MAGTLVVSGTSYAESIAPASVCVDPSKGKDMALCMAIIGMVRDMMHEPRPAAKFKACSPVPLDDPTESYAVREWIEAHPERQGESLGDLVPEVLQTLHPCT